MRYKTPQEQWDRSYCILDYRARHAKNPETYNKENTTTNTTIQNTGRSLCDSNHIRYPGSAYVPGPRQRLECFGLPKLGQGPPCGKDLRQSPPNTRKSLRDSYQIRYPGKAYVPGPRQGRERFGLLLPGPSIIQNDLR